MSQAGSSQFQEVIRQELEYSMKVELDKILATAHSNEIEVRSTEWELLRAWEMGCRTSRQTSDKEIKHGFPGPYFWDMLLSCVEE